MNGCLVRSSKEIRGESTARGTPQSCLKFRNMRTRSGLLTICVPCHKVWSLSCPRFLAKAQSDRNVTLVEMLTHCLHVASMVSRSTDLVLLNQHQLIINYKPDKLTSGSQLTRLVASERSFPVNAGCFRMYARRRARTRQIFSIPCKQLLHEWNASFRSSYGQ